MGFSVAELMPLAGSLADGSPIDWRAVEANTMAHQRGIIGQLRVIATLADLHRSSSADPATTPARDSDQVDRAPAIGSWGHLDLLEGLGGGSFGVVYRAWDRHLQREVALKLLRGHESLDDPMTSRLVLEGRRLAKVRHPNVVAVHGVLEQDHQVGLWMDLIQGATLAKLLAEHGPFGAREAANIGVDLCRALAAVHGAGVIHRDVKAQNVMREAGGRIVLMDLGTGCEIDPKSQPPASDNLAGTPLYLAPELFAGAPASERTDLYSLGVLLYHLVTGSFPVRAASLAELRVAHASGSMVRLRDVRPDLPTAFVRAVDRAITPVAERRYASAGAFEADLGEALADSREAPRHIEEPRDSGRSLSWLRFLSIAAVLPVVALAGWMALRHWSSPGATASTSIQSIAVLPLENVSGDPSQEYFADAMTDELIGTLGRMRELRVISRTSVSQFKGSHQTTPEIAKRLAVDAILEGSVLVTPAAADDTSGQKRVRINARLILAGSDRQLWTRTFDRVLNDILALQSDVARAVADEVHLQLPQEQRSAMASQDRGNPQAEEAYLEGRSLLKNSSREGLVDARRALERAVRLDPLHARAHASLSICYVWLELVGVLPAADARSLAVGSANRALQLNPDLAEAHAALGDALFFYDWDSERAGSAYSRALELSPSYTFARRQYAWYLAATGHPDRALEQAKLAEGADPLSADARAAVAMMYYFNRQYDAAISEMRRSLELAPDGAQQHNGLARAYAGKGAFADAIRELEEAIRLSSRAPVYVAELARTYAASGNRTKALEVLGQLQAMTRTSETFVTPQAFAYVHAALGDKDEAFQFLDRAVRERAVDVLWAGVDPRLDPLRTDSRFAPIVGRISPPAR